MAAESPPAPAVGVFDRREEMMLNIIRLVCLLVFSITMSCGCQGGEFKETFPDHAKGRDPHRTEHEKSAPSGKERPDYVPGQILVKFKQGTDDETIEAIQRELRLKTLKIVSRPNLYLMKILNGSSVESIMERLKDFQEVVYSEPNHVVTIQ